MHAGGAHVWDHHHRHQHHHAPAIAANRGGVRGAGPAFPNNYALIFAAAGVLFVLSIIPGLFFNELPGGKAVEKIPALREFVPALGRVLCDDGPFRAFILVRMFTNLFMMAAPFYIGYATVDLGLSSEVAVPVLVAMTTIGSLIGALAYTWLGERNNLLFIRLALGSAVLMPLCALVASRPGQLLGPWPLYVGFLVSGLAASSNLFAAFMNWAVDYADADERPIYVGLSNTVSALVSLLAPFLGGTSGRAIGVSSALCRGDGDGRGGTLHCGALSADKLVAEMPLEAVASQSHEW
ncbi:MAG: MFS transporter [Caldilineaceae bacterium]